MIDMIQNILLAIVIIWILIILISTIKSLYKRDKKSVDETIISIIDSKKNSVAEDIKIAKNNGFDLSKFNLNQKR